MGWCFCSITVMCIKTHCWCWRQEGLLAPDPNQGPLHPVRRRWGPLVAGGGTGAADSRDIFWGNMVWSDWKGKDKNLYYFQNMQGTLVVVNTNRVSLIGSDRKFCCLWFFFPVGWFCFVWARETKRPFEHMADKQDHNHWCYHSWKNPFCCTHHHGKCSQGVKPHLTLCFGLVLQFSVLQPKVEPETELGTPLCVLLRDPYILLAAGERDVSVTSQHFLFAHFVLNLLVSSFFPHRVSYNYLILCACGFTCVYISCNFHVSEQFYHFTIVSLTSIATTGLGEEVKR